MGVNIHILADERHRVIRDLLALQGQVLATDLVARFGVSEDTVRRDLRELAKEGACRRVYGGAVAPAPDRGDVRRRSAIAAVEKERLAAAVVGLLGPRQLVFIDAGSTNIAVARALPAGLDLTVATNSVGVACALSERSDIRLIVLGGCFDQRTGACLGAETLRAIDGLSADTCILGACALDAGAGVTCFSPDDAEAKRAMVRNSRAVIVAAIADKLGTAAPYRVAPASAMTHLVVEKGVPADVLAPFAAAGSAICEA